MYEIIFKQQLNYVNNRLEAGNHTIDYNPKADYIAITNSDICLQGEAYQDFINTVYGIYDINTHGWTDCIRIAFYPHMDIL